MIELFNDTWSLSLYNERRAFSLPSGHPGAAVRLSLAVLSGSVGTPLTVRWADATGEHDFATPRTIDGTTTTVFLTADELQGVDALAVSNPASQTAIVRLVVGVESPEAPNGRPERRAIERT